MLTLILINSIMRPLKSAIVYGDAVYRLIVSGGTGLHADGRGANGDIEVPILRLIRKWII